MKTWKEGGQADRKYKKARRTQYGDLNELVCAPRFRNMPLTGRLVEEKALLLSIEIGHDEFTVSNGWLKEFKKRNNIHASVLSGESADVPKELMEDGK